MPPADELDKLIRLLGTITELQPDRFGQTLGGTFKPTHDNRWWRFFTAELNDDLFTHAELRLHQDGDRALLHLSTPRLPAPIDEALGLERLGEPMSVEVNSELPPEGVLTYVFDLAPVQVSLQFGRRSRELQALIVQWPRAAAVVRT